MSFIIKTAKTVDEAIENGLRELGVSRDQVEIEVIEEAKSGFLGFGQKDAMVKIKQKEDISSFVRDILYDGKKEDQPAEPVQEPLVKENKPAEQPEELPVKEEIEVEATETIKAVENEEVEKIGTLQEEVTTTEENFVAEETSLEENKEETYDEEDDEEYSRPARAKRNIEEVWSDIEIKNKSEEFLSKIIDQFEIEYGLNFNLSEEGLKVEVTSQNPQELGIIIGKHGSTLDSLQYLLSQVLNNHKEEFIRVTVDANDYREKRRRNLEKIAKRGIERVKKYGRPVKLEPMNAADRRIVHMLLQGYDDLKTHSEGRDPFRRVVITKMRKY